jgi:hypothetical protein
VTGFKEFVPVQQYIQGLEVNSYFIDDEDSGAGHLDTNVLGFTFFFGNAVMVSNFQLATACSC